MRNTLSGSAKRKLKKKHDSKVSGKTEKEAEKAEVLKEEERKVGLYILLHLS